MPLTGLLERILRRRPRPSVELTVVEQISMQLLFSQRTATAHNIYTEVVTRRPLQKAEALTSLVGLEEKGLVAGDGTDSKGRRLYVATKFGQRLRGRLPSEPRSVTVFWP